MDSPLQRSPLLTIDDAYAVQARYVAARLAEGVPPRGYKIGAGAQPTYGVIFADRIATNGASIRLDRLIEPRVEVEIGFIMRRRLSGPTATIDHVLAATRAVVPCFEIIDSRIIGWGLSPIEIVADNGHAAHVVVGAPGVRPAGVDLPVAEVVLHQNGAITATGTAAAPVGDPAASVAWLANALSLRGKAIEEGDLVLSGAITSGVPATRGDEFHAFVAGVGEVICRFV